MAAKKRRAPKGSLGEVFVLRLPRELRKAAQKAAKAAGVTESEWWRRAGRLAIDGVIYTCDCGAVGRKRIYLQYER